MVDLGTLGGRTSCPNDVNDLGYIVGVSQTDRTDAGGLPLTRAFLRMPDGSLLDLGTLGGNHSSAAAISEEAGGVLRIAGHSHDAAAAVRAVLWTVRLGECGGGFAVLAPRAGERYHTCGFPAHTHTLEGGTMTAPSLSTKELRRVVLAPAVGNG